MTLFEELKRNQAIVKACHESARKAAAGRKVRVVTDMTGQPYGKSRPSQIGSDVQDCQCAAGHR